MFANLFPMEKIFYRPEKVGSWSEIQLLLKYCSGNLFVEIYFIRRSQPTPYEEFEAFFLSFEGCLEVFALF
jgi:hypothetical protein